MILVSFVWDGETVIRAMVSGRGMMFDIDNRHQRVCVGEGEGESAVRRGPYAIGSGHMYGDEAGLAWGMARAPEVVEKDMVVSGSEAPA